MKRQSFARMIAFIVIAAGTAVMFGWLFDIGILKSVHPAWVTMKFSTAVSFLLSGIILFYITRVEEDGVPQIVLAISSLIILLVMATLLFSTFTGIQTGIENLFVREAASAVKTTVPGRPAVPTKINFILIGMAGLLAMQKSKRLLPVIGYVIAVVSGIALIGYIINMPLLTYYIEGVSIPMALHTAILFVLLGAGLIIAK